MLIWNLAKEENGNNPAGYYLGTDIAGMGDVFSDVLDPGNLPKNDKESIKNSNLFTDCGNERLFLRIKLPHLGESEDLGCRSKYDL